MFKTKKEIISWLEFYRVRHYEINDSLIVNVHSSVDITNLNITEIPFQFGHIEGHFECSNNLLTSCKGFPTSLTGNLTCDYNQITSLLGCPESVETFRCGNNCLISLEGGPKRCNGSFSCAKNQLTSLDGCPEYVNGRFYCDHNPIKTLANFSCVMNRFIHACSKERMIPGYEYFYKELDVLGKDDPKVSFSGNYPEVMAIIRKVELNKELSKLEVKETKTKPTKV